MNVSDESLACCIYRFRKFFVDNGKGIKTNYSKGYWLHSVVPTPTI